MLWQMFDLAAFSAARSGVSFSKLFNRLELFNRLWGKATPNCWSRSTDESQPKRIGLKNYRVRDCIV